MDRPVDRPAGEYGLGKVAALMALVSDILALVYEDILEPNGPVLGIVTDEQLIELINLALQDFLQKTAGLYGYVYTQPVAQGVGQYQYPDAMQRADLAFLGGALLEPATVATLNAASRGWRINQGLPTRWHQDQLPIQTVELADLPNCDSPVFPAQQTFYPVIAGVTTPPDQAGALTITGPAAPTAVTALTSPLPIVDDDWALTAVSFGLLSRLFRSDSELHDDARAQWCEQQFNDLCALGAFISGEPDAA